jgi:hypothetical protein
MKLGDIGQLAPDVEAWYPVYRLVLKKLVTMQEMKTCVSYKEMLQMNALLDMQDDIKTASAGYKEK